MKNLLEYDEFVKHLNSNGICSNKDAEGYRIKKLAGLDTSDSVNKYCIVISVEYYHGNSFLITEHEKYKGFKKTTNRYTSHPANPDIPVQAHYHIYPKFIR
jgi:hypothetical protein